MEKLFSVTQQPQFSGTTMCQGRLWRGMNKVKHEGLQYKKNYLQRSQRGGREGKSEGGLI